MFIVLPAPPSQGPTFAGIPVYSFSLGPGGLGILAGLAGLAPGRQACLLRHTVIEYTNTLLRLDARYAPFYKTPLLGCIGRIILFVYNEFKCTGRVSSP